MYNIMYHKWSLFFTELTEKEDGNFTMWKTTYENDFTELEELDR